jgi:hypothetical protein
VRCIFCLEPNPPSGFTEEHVFPEAVGGTLIIDVVCTTCNNTLGHTADVAVTDHALVAIQRQAFRLAGKSGKVPNPLARATLASDPTQKLRVTVDPKTGEQDIHVVTSVETETIAPGEAVMSIRIDARDVGNLGTIVNKALRRRGAPTLSQEQIDALPLNFRKTERPPVNVPLTIGVAGYHRGLMKIAYELAWRWLGDSYVDNPVAVRLRAFISDPEVTIDSLNKHKIRAKMHLAPPKSLVDYWPEERDHLVAFTVRSGGLLYITVSVLGAVSGTVALTSSLGEFAECETRFISINPLSGVIRESSFEDEVHSLPGNDDDEAEG